MPLRSPLILDLDGGVLPLPQAQTLALPQWHDPLRFACSNATLDRFAADVLAPLPAQLGTVMLGSGDFHHLSLPLLRRMHGQARSSWWCWTTIRTTCGSRSACTAARG